MRAHSIDQRDRRAFAPSQCVAQPRRKLEPAGAAADDDDAMRYSVVSHES